jgi:hypothetical protein
MKKITTKTKVSPAPATKPVAEKPVAKKKSATTTRAKAPAPAAPAAPQAPVAAPKSLSAPVVAKPVVAPVAAKPVIAPVAAKPVVAPVAAAPVVIQPVKPEPVVTTITAQIDVGFGNALFIRGEGPGLSWDDGVEMECIGNELWRICLGESARGFTFKFLVNDLSWSTGPDYSVASGAAVTLIPQF